MSLRATESRPDIRELAQRAELEFHERPHRFRRRCWRWGVALAVACFAWVAGSYLIGDHRIYEAGPLSKSHAFIANDCRQCHLAWQPAQRLITTTHHISSVDNAACLKCHAADEHHSNQVPRHDEISCAACHREHQGQAELAQVTDRHCARCHNFLVTVDGPTKTYAHSIRGFSLLDGHPEFNLLQRQQSSRVASNLITPAEFEKLSREHPDQAAYQRQFLDVLKRPDEPVHHVSQTHWRDRGEIQFNHATHLAPGRMRDKSGKSVDLSQNCAACHVPDATGRYMQPIRYEQHCASCHPLLFDNSNYPGQVVPHDAPDIVRGFLTRKYTLAALHREAPFSKPERPRPLPGEQDPEALSAEQAQRVEQLVQAAERQAQDFTRAVTGRGGCKLCHTLSGDVAGENWSIVPPNIPDRWLPHARFDHSPHRMLDCGECHGQVNTKKATADVMLAGITTCRECHISAGSSPKLTTNTRNRSHPSPSIAHEVSSSCVMCHSYHRRPADKTTGHLNVRLNTQRPRK